MPGITQSIHPCPLATIVLVATSCVKQVPISKSSCSVASSPHTVGDMTSKPNPRFDPSRRRRGLVLGIYNGVLWSIGNGLTTGALIYYLALDLGADGLMLGLLLAMPAAVGVFQLAAPRLIRWRGSAKRLCLEAFGASYLMLALLPLMLMYSRSSSTALAWLMIVLFCTHQLLEFVGTVALWSWFADLVPLPIRGRYFARRQIYQLTFLIPTLLASGFLADWWRNVVPQEMLPGYAVLTGLGVTLLIVSLLPLARMPKTPTLPKKISATQSVWWRFRAPLADRRFRWLVLYACWLSFFNGVTQVAQSRYPWEVLGLGLLPLALMRSGMRVGQIGTSAIVGPLSDRLGNRPMLIVAQFLVATGPLFYFIASNRSAWSPYWIAVAYFLWSAYAAINICRPNLMLKLAPAETKADYIAVMLAASSVAYAASTVVGGIWFDRLRQSGPFVVGTWELDHYDVQFLFGWVTRLMAIAFLVPIAEPSAWRWFPRIREGRPAE